MSWRKIPPERQVPGHDRASFCRPDCDASSRCPHCFRPCRHRYLRHLSPEGKLGYCPGGSEEFIAFRRRLQPDHHPHVHSNGLFLFFERPCPRPLHRCIELAVPYPGRPCHCDGLRLWYFWGHVRGERCRGCRDGAPCHDQYAPPGLFRGSGSRLGERWSDARHPDSPQCSDGHLRISDADIHWKAARCRSHTRNHFGDSARPVYPRLGHH